MEEVGGCGGWEEGVEEVDEREGPCGGLEVGG